VQIRQQVLGALNLIPRASHIIGAQIDISNGAPHTASFMLFRCLQWLRLPPKM